MSFSFLVEDLETEGRCQCIGEDLRLNSKTRQARQDYGNLAITSRTPPYLNTSRTLVGPC